MSSVPATEFKAKCLELVDRVAERRETFVITKWGKPVAQLVPVERRLLEVAKHHPKPRDSIFGGLRGKGSITGDILGAAVPPDAWETLKEWDELSAARKAQQIRRRRKARKSGRSRR